ncbi:N-acetyltransferase [Rossellomorea marisflavi]|uniref:GNAT family N-acetyltransferase n=1 Tax=Rossellomorea marisflavi TaxID=189381 RepID=UPI0025CB58AA|nr:GNAT family N-acetyltransferase [Rossellomorea marisflavi]GLI84004.1 N-acetyltransferase [Rossellomorea marisflavi]
MIRSAQMKDYGSLTVLMGYLGYPATSEQMHARLERIVEKEDHYTLVAELDGRVVGMIGFHTGYLYTQDEMYARVIALVVDSSIRNKGIGGELLKEAETLAKSLGATGMGLNSGNRTEREDAHRFYERMGYTAKSTGFVKSLHS